LVDYCTTLNAGIGYRVGLAQRGLLATIQFNKKSIKRIKIFLLEMWKSCEGPYVWKPTVLQLHVYIIDQSDPRPLQDYELEQLLIIKYDL